MAASDKNIVISPQRGSTTLAPSIVFTGDGADPISAYALDGAVGSLSFEGSAGQLFSITNNLTSGSIFSVNDVSGIPSLDVDANGTVSIAAYGGNVGVGTTSPATKLDVSGTVTATAFAGPLTGNASTATTLQTARTINGTSFNGSADITTANWGTARTLTIGSTGKSVNGSGNVSWSRLEIGVPQTTTTTNINIENGESCIAYVTNTLFGQSDGALYSHVYSSLWKHQIQGDYRTGQIAVRGKNNGTWQAWRQVWDSSNDGAGSGLDADLLDGENLVDNASTANTVVGRDGSGNITSANLQAAFQVLNLDTQKAPGLYQYDGAFTGTKPPDNAANYRTIEIGAGSRYTEVALPWDKANMYFRRNTDGVWSSWSTVWHNDNDGSGSGLDADLLDGLNSTAFLRSNVDTSASGIVDFTGGSGTNPAIRIRSGGSNWSDGLAVHPSSDNGFALSFFRTRSSFTDSTNTWAIGNLGTNSTNNFGLLRNGLSGGSGVRGDSIFDVTQAGTFRFGFTPTVGANTIWHAGNDGSGSGLDADLLDGFQWDSSGKNVRATEFYADNWFRNYNSGEGLFNEATAMHWFSDANNRWRLYSTQTSASILFTTNGDTARGYLYADTASSIGFLNTAGQWGLRYLSNDGNSPNLYFREEANETWTGDPGNDEGKVEYHSNRFYIASGANSTEIIRFRRSGTDVAIIDNDGSIRAPRYFDNNNTAFYIDPASTSILNTLNLSALQFDGRTAWDTASTAQNGTLSLGYLTVGTGWSKIYRDEDFSNGTNSIALYNNAGGTALSFARIGDATAPNSSRQILRFTYNGGSNGTSPGFGGFYFATGTSVNRTIVCRFKARLKSGSQFDYHSNAIGDNGSQFWVTSQSGSGKWEEYVSVVMCGNSGTFSSTHFYAVSGGSFTNGEILFDLASATVYNVTDNFNVGINRLYADNDIRTPIFYDLNDTAFYCDPNGVSNLGYTQFNDRVSLVKNRGHFTGLESTISAGGRGQLVLNSYYSDIVIASQEFNSNHGSTLSFTSVNPSNSGDYRKFVINQANWGGSHLLRFGWRDGSFGNPHEYVSGGFGSSFDVLGLDGINRITYAFGQMRSPIYYDNNDTGYYVDPNVNTFIRGQLGVQGGHGNTQIRLTANGPELGTGQTSAMTWWISEPGISWNDGGFGYNVTNDNGSPNGFGRLNTGYGQAYMRFTTGGTLLFYNTNTSGTRFTNMELYADNTVYINNYATGGNSLRAPIFYDSNDTTYYIDPASNGTRAGFLNGNLWINPKSESYGEGITFNMPSQATWGGLRWYRNGPAGGFAGNWAFGYFGNESNNDIGFHNGTNGWRLDQSFNMTSNGSVRSPIFYDSNNTGYYLDPAGTSNLNRGSVLGPMHFLANKNTGSDIDPPLQAFSTGGNGAMMSFVRSAYFAVNFGLDSDNVLRIGGWTAAANRWQLDMSGNMTAAGNVTAYSDIRLKDNIEPIDNALEKTLQLTGVTFTRNDQEDKERRHAGVIAQEVEKVLPEVVSEDNEGIKNVAYGNMVGLLIEAIKEQQRMIEELRKEVDNLKKSV